MQTTWSHREILRVHFQNGRQVTGNTAWSRKEEKRQRRRQRVMMVDKSEKKEDGNRA